MFRSPIDTTGISSLGSHGGLVPYIYIIIITIVVLLCSVYFKILRFVLVLVLLGLGDGGQWSSFSIAVCRNLDLGLTWHLDPY